MARWIDRDRSLDPPCRLYDFAWREAHDGHGLWVIRMDATPAFPGQRGFVGGSIGDDAVILEGVIQRGGLD